MTDLGNNIHEHFILFQGLTLQKDQFHKNLGLLVQLFHELKNINGNQKIDVSFLPSGLYLINLKNNKGNKTIRIIKQ